MKETRTMMGMTINIEIVDPKATQKNFEIIFDYLKKVDKRFSTYKHTSEISKINREEIKENEISDEMREVFELGEKTKKETRGFFDIKTPDGEIDPSGIVKGWAIFNAAEILKKNGTNNFCVDIGGDIQVNGKNNKGLPWKIGIRNPFKPETEIIKVVNLTFEGLATSGTYARGDHIYNPHKPNTKIDDIVSISVIGPNILEADRYATAAFAMGRDGIKFIESLKGFEAYMVDSRGMATLTSNFASYTDA